MAAGARAAEPGLPVQPEARGAGLRRREARRLAEEEAQAAEAVEEAVAGRTDA